MSGESVSARPARVVWRNVALRVATLLITGVAQIAFFLVLYAVGLLDSNLAVLAVSGVVLGGMAVVAIRVWPRYPLSEALPADHNPTRWERMTSALLERPATHAVGQAPKIAISLFGILGLSRALVASGSPLGRAGAGVVLGAGLLVALLVLWMPRPRRQIIGDRTPLDEAVLMVGILAILAAAAFAFGTRELHRAGLVDLTRPGGGSAGSLDADRLVWFYGWHLLNALPGSPLSTLRIDAPYDYAQTRVGVMILAFTLVVISPLLRLLKQTISRHKDAQPDTTSPPEATGHLGA